MCAWDIEVCVHGSSGVRRRHPGALWLRVTAPQHHHHQQSKADELSIAQEERVVFEAKIADAERMIDEHGAGATWRSKSVRVKLTGGAVQLQDGDESQDALLSLVLELWAVEPTHDAGSGGDDEDAFLSSVGCARIDLKQWREAPSVAATRWYVLRCALNSSKEAWSGSESSVFDEREERLQPRGVYFQVTLIDLLPANKKTKGDAGAPKASADARPSSSPSCTSAANLGFQFSLPSQCVTQNRRFLSARVGEIVYEGNTEHLRELLPVVLYGKAQMSTDPSQLRRRSSQQARDRRCLNTGLQLLQLSGQYACYCATQLDESTRNAELKQTELLHYKANLQTRRRKMELEKRNLSRELQVLDSTLDGMRMLLQQVDPECLARLTEGHQQSA